jgi:hypothetical protein
MDNDTLDMLLNNKLSEIENELCKFDPEHESEDFNFICFYDLLGSNLPVHNIYEMCKNKINQVDAETEFDIDSLKDEV